MRKIAIYGIGEEGKKYIDRCLASGISNLMLTDSNSSLWDSEYRGLKIHNPNDISWSDCTWIVISVGNQYKPEIFERLVTIYKQPKEKIVFYEETLILSEDEKYNWGGVKFRESFDFKTCLTTGREIGNKLSVESMNHLEKFFYKDSHRPLCKLAHYFDAYDRFFSRYRGKDVAILEIGVSKGGSMQMWKIISKHLPTGCAFMA